MTEAAQTYTIDLCTCASRAFLHYDFEYCHDNKEYDTAIDVVAMYISVKYALIFLS